MGDNLFSPALDRILPATERYFGKSTIHFPPIPLAAPSTMKVIITGASGVLGRATTRYFHSKGDTVVPLSFTRSGPSDSLSLPAYQKLDLLDFEATREFFQAQNSESHVDVIVHCAAERRPDVAEQDPERAEKLNKDVVKLVAELAEQLECLMIYVSTDYVFDGKNPPYKPADKPNPLNLYGHLKEAGEQAVLSSRQTSKHPDQVGKGSIVLRVPLLYGEVEYNSETAVNIFVDVIQDQSGKTYKMDHFAVRFPTCVEDVARVMYDLSRQYHFFFLHSSTSVADYFPRSNLPSARVDHSKPLPPIVHFSSQKGYTKYEMTRLIASFMNLPIDHVIPDTTDPSTLPNQTVQRPGNTQLSVEALENDVGISAKEDKGFERWWKEWAEKHSANKA
ncbi:hypothetical protein QFC19_003671 [Naganishia cerealis]|uniref:Uncharacterized protein n=1 Tax=Naganishia cerealis TaxID=610337 RepID=A0ACC2VZX5_9TREE|nr:hypothetical protein QFC19_003671 [Naganishia cerealis]